MVSSPAPSNVAQLSFEEALKELESIVKALESGNTDLERAIADYTRGAELKEHCQKKLADAKLKVEKITSSASGVVSTEPFDTQTA